MRVQKPTGEFRDGLKSYTTPQLTDYGEVTKVTAGQATGNILDQTFPTGTPFNQLTFS